MDLLDSDAENKSPSTEETKSNDNPVPLVMTEGTEPSPLPNINTGMTQRHTAAAASVQPSPSTNTQQDQTTSFTHYSGPTDVEENAHSLPATLTDGIHQPPKDGGNKAVIYFKRALYDKKMALNFFVVVLIGTVSLMTSVKLMKNTPMFPSVTTSSIELRKDSTYKDIQLGHEMSGMEVSQVYPNIVWLFAFPQSGAAYVMHLIHVVTRTATASNYGHVVMDPKGVVHVNNRDSIRTYGSGGPALFSGSIFPPPEKHILTWAAGKCISRRKNFAVLKYRLLYDSLYLKRQRVTHYVCNLSQVTGHVGIVIQKIICIIMPSFVSFAGEVRS